MTQAFISTSDAPPPLPIFSQAVVSNDRRVYVSGNIGLKRTESSGEGQTHRWKLAEGVQEQTRAILENISVVLKAAGSDLEHIVKANIYLTDLPRDFASMNEVYVGFFEAGKMPARTCIGVAALPMGANVEMECIADVISDGVN